MTSFFHISEASAIAIHCCVLMGAAEDAVLSAKKASEQLGTSYDHTVRVLHRLRQAGVLESVRGPSGGFRLLKPAKKLSALAVIETMDGKTCAKNCLFNKKHCKGRCRLFGTLMRDIDQRARDYFSQTTIHQLATQKQEENS